MPGRVVILGAGGHAREVLEILLECCANGSMAVPVGFIDENPENHGRVLDGFPVLGDFRWFQETDDAQGVETVCAVGSPRTCRSLSMKASAMGLRFARVISPRSVISPRATIGEGVIIFPHVIVNTGAAIGNHVTLNVASTVSHDTRVGDFCNVNPGSHLAGNVIIGEGCFVGMGANLIQGITVGAWTVIGAGAVVIRDLPPNVTAVGVPARAIGAHAQSEVDQ